MNGSLEMHASAIGGPSVQADVDDKLHWPAPYSPSLFGTNSVDQRRKSVGVNDASPRNQIQKRDPLIVGPFCVLCAVWPYETWMRQAKQVDASGGRPVRWYFAEAHRARPAGASGKSILHRCDVCEHTR